MKIECIVEELKELLIKEQTEHQSECSNITLKIGSKQLADEITNCLANRDKSQEDLT